MDAEQKHREDLSTFVDGELEDEKIDHLLSKIQDNDAYDDWELYHQIGDVLRSSDNGVQLSEGFFSALQAKLALEEPHRIDSLSSQPDSSEPEVGSETEQPSKNHWALPGLLATAATSAALLALPHQLVMSSTVKETCSETANGSALIKEARIVLPDGVKSA